MALLPPMTSYRYVVNTMKLNDNMFFKFELITEEMHWVNAKYMVELRRDILDSTIDSPLFANKILEVTLRRN